MAEAIIIRLEKPLPGVSSQATFAAFGKNWDALESASEALETLSPFDFVSETPEEYAAMMKDVKEVEKELGNFNIDEIKNNPEFRQILADLGNDPDVLQAMQNAKSPDELLGQVFPEESPGEEWYDPAEGLDFVRRMDTYVKEHPVQFAEPAKLRQDLQQIAATLDAARQAGVQFYFALQG